VSDEYEEMGRGELLARVHDWRQLANDRSVEISRLRAALADAQKDVEEVARVLRQSVAAVDGEIVHRTAALYRSLALAEAGAHLAPDGPAGEDT
jgi:hypothetical protein